MCITSLELDKSHCSRPISQPSRWLPFQYPTIMSISNYLVCFFSVTVKSSYYVLGDTVYSENKFFFIYTPSDLSPPNWKPKRLSVISHSENKPLCLGLCLGITLKYKINQSKLHIPLSGMIKLFFTNITIPYPNCTRQAQIARAFARKISTQFEPFLMN